MTDDPTRSAYVVLQVRDDAEEIVIRAAFRALASHYHPDANQSAGAERRMAEINAAYACVRTRDRRQAYDRTRHPVQANAAPIVPPGTSTWRPASRTTGGDIDFGRYAGWTLEQLALHDPDYLRWLSRHSSGIRYRQRIDVLLSASPKPRAPDQKVGRR
ncbi:MAG: DnaJ domain-containing protein [Candidatus Limnocylindria bacterium]